MKTKKEWAPVRPYQQWPVFEAQPFDPRQSTFVPARSIGNSQIASISPRKVRLVGIKIYNAAAANSIVTGTDTTVTFDTISFAQDVIPPTGATFTGFRIPYDGVYLLEANIEWASEHLARMSWFYLNSVKIEGDTRSSAAADTAILSRVALPATRNLMANDLLELRVRQEAGVNVSINTGQDNCSLAVVYLGTI